MLEDYPYCQPVRMLYVKSIMKGNSKHYDEQFNKALACAPDRRVFYEYINNGINTNEAADNRNDNDASTQKTNNQTETEPHDTVIDIVEDNESENQPGFHEQPGTDTHGAVGEDDSKTADLASRKHYQQQIIDRFLEKDPRVEIRREGVTPGELSRCSIEDNPDLASETLAEILLKQGKKERAILIYKKLILMFPEKSSYFAKKLENIN